MDSSDKTEVEFVDRHLDYGEELGASNRENLPAMNVSTSTTAMFVILLMAIWFSFPTGATGEEYALDIDSLPQEGVPSSEAKSDFELDYLVKGQKNGTTPDAD